MGVTYKPALFTPIWNNGPSVSSLRRECRLLMTVFIPVADNVNIHLFSGVHEPNNVGHISVYNKSIRTSAFQKDNFTTCSHRDQDKDAEQTPQTVSRLFQTLQSLKHTYTPMFRPAPPRRKAVYSPQLRSTACFHSKPEPFVLVSR